MMIMLKHVLAYNIRIWKWLILSHIYLTRVFFLCRWTQSPLHSTHNIRVKHVSLFETTENSHPVIGYVMRASRALFSRIIVHSCDRKGDSERRRGRGWQFVLCEVLLITRRMKLSFGLGSGWVGGRVSIVSPSAEIRRRKNKEQKKHKHRQPRTTLLLSPKCCSRGRNNKNY